MAQTFALIACGFFVFVFTWKYRILVGVRNVQRSAFPGCLWRFAVKIAILCSLFLNATSLPFIDEVKPKIKMRMWMSERAAKNHRTTQSIYTSTRAGFFLSWSWSHSFCGPKRSLKWFWKSLIFFPCFLPIFATFAARDACFAHFIIILTMAPFRCWSIKCTLTEEKWMGRARARERFITPKWKQNEWNEYKQRYNGNGKNHQRDGHAFGPRDQGNASWYRINKPRKRREKNL